jgi:AmiR/NasT family two-component response regulator
MRLDEEARINIATGIVMERRHLSATESLASITAAARRADCDPLDLADELIRTRGNSPDLTA